MSLDGGCDFHDVQGGFCRMVGPLIVIDDPLTFVSCHCVLVICRTRHASILFLLIVRVLDQLSQSMSQEIVNEDKNDARGRQWETTSLLRLFAPPSF